MIYFNRYNKPFAMCGCIFPIRHTNMPQVYSQWIVLNITQSEAT